ncbi:hypothetical protein [Salinirubrum litoreum]|uniref:DUF7984 domain-containing protein n=1 Tax=Salinirubrum litoreum TaxID=1126234 RepID=A0ABD5R9T8_9EURY|nr:hypothetical protein [Salinirubrum litoreum]
MRLTPDRVRDEYDWFHDRAPAIAETITETRTGLGELFGVEVDPVTTAQVRDEIDAVFADGAVAVNVAGYVALLKELDVTDDYPGFVVDEVLGRELAATIAGGQPLALLAQATFHYADLHTHSDGPAGVDDLDAAVAAGLQTRLPGWDWQDEPSPFAVSTERDE